MLTDQGFQINDVVQHGVHYPRQLEPGQYSFPKNDFSGRITLKSAADGSILLSRLASKISKLASP